MLDQILSRSSALSVQQRVVTAFAALLLGSFMLAGVGFAEAVHNTAHDTRHAFTFPCH